MLAGNPCGAGSGKHDALGPRPEPAPAHKKAAGGPRRQATIVTETLPNVCAGKSLRCALLVRQPGRNPHLWVYRLRFLRCVRLALYSARRFAQRFLARPRECSRCQMVTPSDLEAQAEVLGADRHQRLGTGLDGSLVGAGARQQTLVEEAGGIELGPVEGGLLGAFGRSEEHT